MQIYLTHKVFIGFLYVKENPFDLWIDFCKTLYFKVISVAGNECAVRCWKTQRSIKYGGENLIIIWGLVLTILVFQLHNWGWWKICTQLFKKSVAVGLGGGVRGLYETFFPGSCSFLGSSNYHPFSLHTNFIFLFVLSFHLIKSNCYLLQLNV